MMIFKSISLHQRPYVPLSICETHLASLFVEFESTNVCSWSGWSIWNQTHCWWVPFEPNVQIKSFRILGRIVPAIGTTTSTVSGLVSCLDEFVFDNLLHMSIDCCWTCQIMSESIERSFLGCLQKFLHQYCTTVFYLQWTISVWNTTGWVWLIFFFEIDGFASSTIFRRFEVNIWSSFEIKGNPDMTLEGFIQEVEVSS